ncbi:hypothetical protein C8R47DRAFT_1139844 [Mycena vitilis]|nr:hypothetical protein C8R47DRAFT_1139844 [Mycena vitilis]
MAFSGKLEFAYENASPQTQASHHLQLCLTELRWQRILISARKIMSFLRLLFNSDSFLLETEENSCDRLSLMRDHPSKMIVGILDYRTDVPESHIMTLDLARTEDEDGKICWDEHIARAARSGGRMELRVMRILDGSCTRLMMLPKHVEQPTLHDGLVRILGQVPRESDWQQEAEDYIPMHTHSILRSSMSRSVPLNQALFPHAPSPRKTHSERSMQLAGTRSKAPCMGEFASYRWSKVQRSAREVVYVSVCRQAI